MLWAPDLMKGISYSQAGHRNVLLHTLVEKHSDGHDILKQTKVIKISKLALDKNDKPTVAFS